MLLENLFHNLPGKPAFRHFNFFDYNPETHQKKVRPLVAQNDAMKLIHQRFSMNLRRLNVDLSSAEGSLPGRSRIHNLLRHRNIPPERLGRNSHGQCKFPRYFFLTDIEGAFPNTCLLRLAQILCKLDCETNFEAMVFFLHVFCGTKEEGLLQGTSSAGDLFNIYVATLVDQQVREYVRKFDITYTRYCDDLLFSTNRDLGIGKKIRRHVRSIVNSAGFPISDRKTKLFDLQKHPGFINGLGIKQSGHIFVPEERLRTMSRLVYRVEKGEFDLWPRVAGLTGLLKDVERYTSSRSSRRARQIISKMNTLKKVVPHPQRLS